MSESIENAKITDVSISMADHGCLTFTIYVQGAVYACGFGGYAIGHGYLGADYWDGNGAGLVAMMKIMDVVEVEKWEHLKGKLVRVKYNSSGHITEIGNIIANKWFNIADFFSAVTDESKFVLAERVQEDDDEDDDR